MSSINQLPVPVSQNAPAHWDSMMTNMLPVLSAQFNYTQQIADIVDRSFPFNTRPETVKAKGKLISAELAYIFSEELDAVLPVGTEVKLISEDVCRENLESNTVDAVVKKITKSDEGWDDPKVVFELTSRGEVSSQDLCIHLAGNNKKIKKNLKKTKKLVKDVLALDNPEKQKEFSRPLRTYLSGDFPEAQEITAHKEGLTPSQNRAYQRGIDSENNPVLYISGGGGSGKTTVEMEIAKKHMEEGRSVLILSHPNRGAQVPVLKYLKEEGKHETKKHVFVAGNNTEQIDTKLHPYRILRGAPKYPIDKLKEIGNMKQSEFLEYMNKKGSLVRHNANKREIEYLQKVEKASILAEYNIEKSKHDTLMAKRMSGPTITSSTFGNLLNDSFVKELEYDVVIVDEATRLRTPELFQILQQAKKQIILVGDTEQLGNLPLGVDQRQRMSTYLSTINEDRMNLELGVLPQREIISPEDEHGHYLEYGPNYRTILSHIYGSTNELSTQPMIDGDIDSALDSYENGPFVEAICNCENPEKELPYEYLEENFRSKEGIVRVLSELKYQGKMKPARKVEKEGGVGVIKWLDTRDIESSEKSVGTSKKNQREARFIAYKVLRQLKRKSNPESPENIAVITTYKQQAEAIQKILRKNLTSEMFDAVKDNVATVDSFQGDERKIVYVSLTRSNEEGDIGFLEEVRRIGVAIGRAQNKCYIVGNAETLTEKNKNLDSNKFFTHMHELISEHGEVDILPSNTMKKVNQRIKK